MVKNRNNILTLGQRGKFGDMVFQLYPLAETMEEKIRSQNVGVYQIAICDFLHPPSLDTTELIKETKKYFRFFKEI